MKSDLHKTMYKEMLGQLIKKMRKGMVGDKDEDEGVSMAVSEEDVLEEKGEGEEPDESSDFASPEELAEYLKPKKKKADSEGVMVLAAGGKSMSKPKGVPFKKMSK